MSLQESSVEKDVLKNRLVLEMSRSTAGTVSYEMYKSLDFYFCLLTFQNLPTKSVHISWTYASVTFSIAQFAKNDVQPQYSCLLR